MLFVVFADWCVSGWVCLFSEVTLFTGLILEHALVVCEPDCVWKYATYFV